MAETKLDQIDSTEKIDIVKIKKYPVGSDVNKELIFNFPYILNKETTAYIKKYAQIMFIIRGPPSTGKATLSEMLTDEYPNAVFCCADRYFSETSGNFERTRDSIKDSHVYCQKKTENACQSKAPTIIVQNTHMRKWEMQIYLDYAAQYNYTVIMAITLYRFNCTPKALAENNTDGLDLRYFQRRLAQWEDVLPYFTGWFISPCDSQHILYHLKESLESLLGDGKFCRVCNVFETEDLIEYFKARKVLYCPAGFIKDYNKMKSYYLSDEVQYFYGKCFTLCLLGYLVSPNYIMGIINITKTMKHVFLQNKSPPKESLYNMMSSLNLSSNLQHFSEMSAFPEKDVIPKHTTVEFQEQITEDMNSEAYTFIDLSQKESKMFDIEGSQQQFIKSLKAVDHIFSDTDSNLYTIIEDDGERKVYRLENDVWLIKPAKIVTVKSIFTGLYL